MQVSTLWHGDYLLTVSLSGAINYLDINKPDTPKLVIHGHQKPITDFTLDKLNGVVYTSDGDGNVTQWNTKTGSGKWLDGAGHSKGVAGVAVSCDGKYVWTAGLDDKFRFNDSKSAAYSSDAGDLGGQPLAIAAARKDASLAAAVMAQEKLIILRGKQVASKVDLGFRPTSLTFSADDKEIAVGGNDSKVYLFSLANDVATKKSVLSGNHLVKIVSLNYTPDGSYLVSTDANRFIYFWKGGKVANITGWTYHNAAVTDSSFDSTGARFATSSIDQDIIVWSDTKTFEALYYKIVLAHATGVDHVAFLDDKTLISSGTDRTVKIWALAK